MTHHMLQIAGLEHTSTPPMTVYNPYDRQPVATVDTADWAGADHALTEASRIFSQRHNWLTLPERIDILQNTQTLMQERSETLSELIATEGGKPLTDARIETARAIEGVGLAIMELKTLKGNVIPMGSNAASLNHFAYTRHEPCGVVLAYSAFNHPLNLIVHQAIPAVAAGCPFIIKPAEATPLSCITLVGMLREAGLPNPWGQVIHCDHDVAEKMVADERVRFFSFIGSSRVGWYLRARLASGAHCALEHGGAAPVIVTKNSDWEAAVPLLLKGGLYHAGQVCVSVQRIFAHESIARDLAEKMAGEAEKLRVGAAVDEETDIGPLIRPAEVERVHQWVTEAQEAGGQLLCGGQPQSETCYPATILYNPPAHCNLSQKEVFGPVIAVYPYSDFDEAIERANHPDFAFQSAIFTRDLDLALQAADRLIAKTVLINEHTAFRVDWMPFGGFRKSGLGTGGIGYTLRDMMIEKMVVIRH